MEGSVRQQLPACNAVEAHLNSLLMLVLHGQASLRRHSAMLCSQAMLWSPTRAPSSASALALECFLCIWHGVLWGT